MRFDDALHIVFKSVEVDTRGFVGQAWQTKTDRKKRGIDFAVPELALYQEWICSGFRVWRDIAPTKYMDRSEFRRLGSANSEVGHFGGRPLRHSPGAPPSSPRWRTRATKGWKEEVIGSQLRPPRGTSRQAVSCS